MKLDVKEYLEDQAELAEFELRYHDLIKKDPNYMDEAIERLTKSYAKVFEELKSQNYPNYEAKTREMMREKFGDVYGGLEKLVIRKHNSCF